jgi:hypothetical protein
MKTIAQFHTALTQFGTSNQNYYAVRFERPDVLRFTDLQGRLVDWPNDMTDLYCDSVQIPSRQVNTGDIKQFGTLYRYPTGISYSQIDMTFLSDRNHRLRNVFELWTTAIANDEKNHATYYDQAVSRKLTVFKYEKQKGTTVRNYGDAIRAENRVTAQWEIYNVFPFNIGTYELNNEQSNLLKLNVSFYFEKYRQIYLPTSTSDDRV